MSGNCAIVELETAAAVAPAPALRDLSEDMLRARFALLASLNDEEEPEEDEDDDDEWDDDDFDDDDLDDDDDDDLDEEEEEEPIDEP